MKAELRFINCLKYVEGIEPDVSGDKKEKSFCLLIRCLDDYTLSFVSNNIQPQQDGDGKALWDLLKEKFVGSGVQAQGAALNQFFDIKFQTVEQWVEDLCESTRKIQLSGVPIENYIISIFAIRSLPSKFESLIRVLKNSDRYPEIEDIIDFVESNQAQFSKAFIKSKVALLEESRSVKEKRKCHF
ncbi:hypothetical protein O181_027738 [Austropuccinia psidii MF-1]|uniref:Uncharacterized protein n=1 Tax=Austropuccinia psidii MF-1 TaxID=1389203 RepID=A0A9Q3CSD1_9BASI|nr:hypothetical protein [Austropuccinia psidii MF-1]